MPQNSLDIIPNNVQQVAAAIQAKFGDAEPIPPGHAFHAPRRQHSAPRVRTEAAGPKRTASLHKSKSQGEGKHGGRPDGRDEGSLRRSLSMDHSGPRFDMGISQLGFQESTSL